MAFSTSAGIIGPVIFGIVRLQHLIPSDVRSGRLETWREDARRKARDD